MAEDRKLIRVEVKTVITGLFPDIPVYNGRFSERDIEKFFNIYFTDIDINANVDGVRERHSGLLMVGYNQAGLPSDDDIDVVIDSVRLGIKSDYSLMQTHPVVPSGIKYVNRDDSYYGAFIMYNCQYVVSL